MIPLGNRTSAWFNKGCWSALPLCVPWAKIATVLNCRAALWKARGGFVFQLCGKHAVSPFFVCHYLDFVFVKLRKFVVVLPIFRLTFV